MKSTYLFILFLSIHFISYGQVFIDTDIYVDHTANLYIAANNTEFHTGTILTARGEDYGVVSFAPNAGWSNADHNSHVNGFVRMYNEERFSFPIGHDGIFQPVQILRTDTHSLVDFSFSNVPHDKLSTEKGIQQVSDQFYWTVVGEQPAQISLSWNAFSNLDRLTDNNIDQLIIVGFDGTTWRTIESEIDPISFDEGSSSSLLSGSITSKNPIFLEGYEAFTLASKGDTLNINVSQGFTPNGDGNNDTWFIENIENYPNAKIKVYSRWGREVFVSNGNYQNNWNGRYKDNEETLPDGSYAYTIDLDGDGTMDIAGWIYITE